MIIVELHGPEAMVHWSIDCVVATSKRTELEVFILHLHFSDADDVDGFLAKDAIHWMPNDVCLLANFCFVILVEVESGVVLKRHYKLSFHEVSDVPGASALVARY